MKKTVILLLLVLIPSVYAISLGTPTQRDYFYEANKEIIIEYQAGNSDPRQLNVAVDVDARSLQEYVENAHAVYQIPAEGAHTHVFEF